MFRHEEEHKPKLLSPDFPGGVGVFHMKGWGPKSSVCPSKPGKSNFFDGICRDLYCDREEKRGKPRNPH